MRLRQYALVTRDGETRRCAATIVGQPKEHYETSNVRFVEEGDTVCVVTQSDWDAGRKESKDGTD